MHNKCIYNATIDDLVVGILDSPSLLTPEGVQELYTGPSESIIALWRVNMTLASAALTCMASLIQSLIGLYHEPLR